MEQPFLSFTIYLGSIYIAFLVWHKRILVMEFAQFLCLTVFLKFIYCSEVGTCLKSEFFNQVGFLERIIFTFHSRYLSAIGFNTLKWQPCSLSRSLTLSFPTFWIEFLLYFVPWCLLYFLMPIILEPLIMPSFSFDQLEVISLSSRFWLLHWLL